MTTAVLNDPTSSWGESAKHVNASGDRFAVKDGRHYLGIVMKIGRTEKRECNVFMLDNDIALNDLTTKLRSVDERRHNNALQLETRLRSTQEYRYTPNMLACYHGPLSHEDACRQLVLPGEFIIRDSSMRGEFAVSYKTSHGPHDKSIVPNNNIDFFRRFQVDQSVLKHPVVRRQE
ncbi:SH2 domain-containing protein [Caenorhabditis elegans]|uniref:SH2 domain-containing protein n=1 Tax=Caenorhabditis elegans TaxID=6239 RepID=A0A9J5HVD6_CAEEL|nr:SH2 domain-containing protein [Caenorhabditis elegans]CAI3842061.1 SH2 domain-containing protein [Caenorhabditis elegans]